MAKGDINIKLTISGDGSLKKASTGIDKVVKSEKEAEKQSKKTDQQLKKTNKTAKDYDKQNKSLYQNNLSSAKGFSKMNQTMGSGSSGLVAAYATLAANVFAATAAFNALRRASQTEQLIQALESLGEASGRNLGILADSIKEATGNAIALDQALATASVGASAGFDPTQIKGLAEVGRLAAISLGRDVGDAVDRLTRGAAKLEPEILDELGIFVRLDDAAAQYAASIGKSASELSRFEKRQAFTNAILDQGKQKFDAAAAIDPSPYDQLAATLSDLSRTIMNVFNTLLAPIAGFFANNTLALAGFLAMITKGIMAQALPALQTFGEKALQNANQAEQNANREINASNKAIATLRKRHTPIKGLGASYNDLAKKIQKGEHETKDLEAAQKKLTNYILGAQKRIQKGEVKNIELVNERIKQAETRLKQTRQLAEETKKAQAGSGAIGRARATQKLEGRGAAIFGDLEKSDGGIKAHMTAMKRSITIGKQHMHTTAKNTQMNKFMGMSFLGLAKPMNIAKIGITSFGISARVAIKGITTAIPVIGQLLLVFDLLIAGLKKFMEFLRGMGDEQTALQKANKALVETTKTFRNVQERANTEILSAQESLISQGNATKGLIQASKDQQEQAKKAYDEQNLLGKIQIKFAQRIASFFKIMGRTFSFVSDGIRKAMLKTTISFKSNLLEMQKAMRQFAEDFPNIAGVFFDASDVDVEGTQDELNVLKKELEAIETKGEFQATSVGLSQLNKILSVSDASFGTFETILTGVGDASDELRKSLGGVNADTVIMMATSGKAFGEFEKGVKIQELLANAIDENGAHKYPELLDGIQGAAEMQTLFNALAEEGTINTVTLAEGVENMKNAFRESEQKVGEFVNTLKKSTKFRTVISELQNITSEMDKMFQRDEDGELINADNLEQAKMAIFQTFGEMGKGFNDLVIGPIDQQTLETTRQKFDDQVSALENGNAEQREMAAQMRANGFQAFLISELYEGNTELLEDQVRKVEEQLKLANNLVGTEKVRLSILKSQETAVKAFSKQNDAAAKIQANLANDQLNVTGDRMRAEAAIQEGLLTEETLNKVKKGDIAAINQLKGEEQDRAFALLETYENIRVNDEKIKTEREIQLDVDRALYEQALLNEKNRKEGVKTLKAQTKQLAIQANLAVGRGGQESPAAKLKAEKKAAAEKVKAAMQELSLLGERLSIESEILLINLEQSGVATDDERYIRIKKSLEERLEREKEISREKIKQAIAEEKMVGKSAFKGLQSDTTGSKLVDNVGTFNETIADRTIVTGQDAEGNDITETIKASTQERLEAMSTALQPMRDELMKLGPEGELVVAAQEGILLMASSFDIISEKGLGSAEGLAAVGSAIGAMGKIFAAQSKAQIAEIDKQIAAEQKRDGKSAESMSKIKAMEKKKEEISRKAFERNKKMQMAQTVVNTAASITKALTETPFPMSIALAAMYGAMGAAQLAIISKQKFEGGSTNIEKPKASLSLGKRADSVDVTRATSAGELNYLRGGRTTGQDLGGIPGGAMGRKGYAMGFKSGYADGGVVVGERGPEVITPATDVDIVPNFALGGGTTNVNFSINTIDASGVEDVLMNQQGNIIRMIRQAANENGEDFLETIDTQTYGSST